MKLVPALLFGSLSASGFAGTVGPYQIPANRDQTHGELLLNLGVNYVFAV